MSDLATATESVQRLSEELHASYETNLMLAESLADVQLAAEDAGWQQIGVQIQEALTRQGLAKIVANCRTMAIASPLIKRGLALRGAYVWGQGVEISGRDQDVNALVQLFDEDNQRSFTGSQACEDLERALGTDGNVFLALFTSPLTGRVLVRSTPFDEVIDIMNNPNDRDEPWLYLREYEVTVLEAGTPNMAGIPTGTRSRWERRREYHPAVGWNPPVRPKSVNNVPVNWAAPMLHVAVNRLDGQKWGIPDAFASVAWARAYEGFITDWARLMKSLSRFAWRLSGDKSSKAQRAAAKVQAAVGDLADPTRLPGVGSTAGQMTASGPGMNLEAIPKSGATLDSESGRPLAALVAAGLGLPVTTLLADPGVTGARATAETLDKPTVLEMSMRREVWEWARRTVLGYVIEQAVKAPAGPLTGTVTRDQDGRMQVTLAGAGADATIEFDWPKLDSLDPKALVEAIVAADSTEKVPPPVTMKLLLGALGVKDADEIVEKYTDDDGNWIDPGATAAQAAIDAHRAGGDDPTAMDAA